ncbi:MAG: hypothetical protein IJB49_04485 [Clostridia bacterium]|nr:hypothetical protein [Clostridia bacterium]
MKTRLLALSILLALLLTLLSGCSLFQAGNTSNTEISEPASESEGDTENNQDVKKPIDDPERLKEFLEANGQVPIDEYGSVPKFAEKTDVEFLYKLPIDLATDGNYSMLINRELIYLEYFGDEECKSLIYSLENGELIYERDVSAASNTGILENGGFWYFNIDAPSLVFIDENGTEKTVWQDNSPEFPVPNSVRVSENGKYLALAFDNSSDAESACIYNLENGEKKTFDTEKDDDFYWGVYNYKNCFAFISLEERLAVYDPEADTVSFRKKEFPFGAVYEGLYSSYFDRSLLFGSVENDEFYYAEIDCDGYLSSLQGGIALVNDIYDERAVFKLFNLYTSEKIAELELFGDEHDYPTAFTPNGVLYVLEHTYGFAELYCFDVKSASEKQSEKALAPIVATKDDLVESIAETVKALEDDLAIDILYSSEGNDFCISDYIGAAELNSFTVYTSIKTVDKILRKYPAGMLEEAYKETHEGLKIYLCSDIYGKGDGTLEMAGGVTTEENGFIIIALDVNNNLEYDLPHELSHVFDRRLSYVSFHKDSQTDWLAEWENATEVKNGYIYSYTDYSSSSKYTMYYESNPDRVWFVDEYARTFPTEDRARIFEYLFNNDLSLLEEWNNYPHLIEKAELYCRILRECFDSCKNSETLEWEKFLRERS